MSATDEQLDPNINLSQELMDQTPSEDDVNEMEVDENGDVIDGEFKDTETEIEEAEAVVPQKAKLISAELPSLSNEQGIIDAINNSQLDGTIGEVVLGLMKNIRLQATIDAQNIARATQSATVYGDEYAAGMTQYLAQGMEPQVALAAAAHDKAKENGTEFFDEMAKILQRGGYITNGNVSNANSTNPSVTAPRRPVPADQRIPSGRSSVSPAPNQGTVRTSNDAKLATLFGVDAVKEFRK